MGSEMCIRDSPNWKIERTGEAVTENGLTYRFVDYVNTALL